MAEASGQLVQGDQIIKVNEIDLEKANQVLITKYLLSPFDKKIPTQDFSHLQLERDVMLLNSTMG